MQSSTKANPLPYVARPWWSDAVRSKRFEMGLKAVEVSRLSGVHVNTIARIEDGTKGAPSVDTLDALCDALELDLDVIDISSMVVSAYEWD